MANPEHLELLKQGVEKWNEWRKGNPGITPDLGKANLRACLGIQVDALVGANRRSIRLIIA